MAKAKKVVAAPVVEVYEYCTPEPELKVFATMYIAWNEDGDVVADDADSFESIEQFVNEALGLEHHGWDWAMVEMALPLPAEREEKYFDLKA